MSQPLIKAGPGGPMISGIAPSQDPLTAPFWRVGENVVIRKTGVEKSTGWIEVASLTEDMYELAQAHVNGVDRAYLGGARRVYTYEAGTGVVPITNFISTGNIRLETWGTWLLATNGVDPLRLWKNEAADVIASIPFTWAKIVKRANVHMLAANTSNDPAEIAWCAASNIEDWTPAASNSARNIVLRDLDGEIKAITDIGGSLAAYSSEKVLIGRYAGQPFIFNWNINSLNGIGAIGGRSIVTVGPRNIGLGRQGVFETDGSDFRYVDDPDVQKYLQDTVDWDQGERIVGYHNKILEQVVWHFPTQQGGYAGLPYSYRTKAFGGALSGKFTAVVERFVFDTPIAVVDKKLVFLGGSVNDGSLALASLIQTKPLDAGEGGIRKYFDYLKVIGTWANAKVRIGALEDPNNIDSIQWFYDADLATEHFFERDTPYIVVEFYTTAVDGRYAISQFSINGEVVGLNP